VVWGGISLHCSTPVPIHAQSHLLSFAVLFLVVYSQLRVYVCVCNMHLRLSINPKGTEKGKRKNSATQDIIIWW
jgi:hypothetical protein